MSTFGDEFKDTILLECENARRDGKSVKNILASLVEIMSYIFTYWMDQI
jgi:hypothetical protein